MLDCVKCVEVWDVRSREMIHELTGHLGVVYTIASLGEGKMISAGADTKIRVWAWEQGSCEVLSGHTATVAALCKASSS